MMLCVVLLITYSISYGSVILTNQTSNGSTVLDIVFLRGPDYLQNETRTAIEMAEDRLREEGTVPPWLQFNIIDCCTCSSSYEAAGFEPLVEATEVYYRRNIDAIVGPHCSPGMKYTARMAAIWNKPVFGYLSVSSEFADRANYPTLSRVSITVSSLSTAVVRLLEHLNVTQVGLIKNTGYPFALWLYFGIKNALAKTRIKVNVDVSLNMNHKENITEAFQLIRDNARIVIATMGYYPSHEFMEDLAKHNMTTDEYLFILPSGPGFFGPKFVASVSAAAIEGYSKSLVVHAEGIDSRTSARFRQQMIEEKGVDFYPQVTYSQQFYRDYYQVVHDTFYFYMSIAGEMVLKNQTDTLRNGSALWPHLKNRDFMGASGHVWINDNAERLPNYMVDTVKDGQVESVLHLGIEPLCETSCTKVGSQTIGKVKYQLVPILVSEKMPEFPLDMPVCGFRGEICDMSHVYKGILAATVALIAVGSSVFFYRRWKEKQLYKMPWRVPPEKLIHVKMDQSRQGSLITVQSKHSKSSNQLTENVVLVGREKAEVTPYELQKSVHFGREQLAKLNEVKKIQHENLANFVGLCYENNEKDFKILWSTAARGPLEGVLIDQDIQLDRIFKGSFIRDIIQGLEYMHSSPVNCHGCLNVINCELTSHWMVKLSHFGLQNILLEMDEDGMIVYTKDSDFKLIHVAPELLRQSKSLTKPVASSQEGDIYSLGMVIYQILYRCHPYEDTEEMLTSLLAKEEEIEKPQIPADSRLDKFNEQQLIACWSYDPNRRPTLGDLKGILKALSPKGGSLVDNMMKMMDSYAGNLEKLVRDRTILLEEAQRQADQLLFRMLPQSIAMDLKAGKAIDPKIYPNATISFTDIVGFTAVCSQSTPLQIVTFLNKLFSSFDEIIEAHDAYKVETIGDCYLIVSGLPKVNGEKHAYEIASIVLMFRKCASMFKLGHMPNKKLEVRSGVNTGPVATGVIGVSAPSYCLFGDTVNVASRMESTGEPMKIQISESTKELLEKWPDKFNIQERGTVVVKGKGEQLTYWLEEKTI